MKKESMIAALEAKGFKIVKDGEYIPGENHFIIIRNGVTRYFESCTEAYELLKDED